MKYYLVGIKGSAMSALAKLLHKDGHLVRGIDIEGDFYTCIDLDVKIDNFNNYQLKKTYFYIIGNSFINSQIHNYIINNNFYYMTYPAFLNFYYRYKKWICVAGSHGKTTTTKLLAHLIEDSTCLIGDGEFYTGNNDFFILESCEYRDTFLNYQPFISLILNIDYDHPDYFINEEQYVNSFKKFINNSDIVIVNNEKYHFDNVITYGSEESDVCYQYKDNYVHILNKSFRLPYPGKGFRVDFVGAYLVCKLLNVSDEVIEKRLATYKLPKRRMETSLVGDNIIVSDYAHHPTEIKSLFECLKSIYPYKRIICIFEPHTLSRLSQYLIDFRVSLSLFDECYLVKLYNSREKENKMLEKELYKKLNFQIFNMKMFWNNSVIVFMGAGKIDKICNDYIKKIKTI